MTPAFGGASLALIVLGLIVAVAWIFIPFAIIGTKPLLRELIAEIRKGNEILAAVRENSHPEAAERLAAAAAQSRPVGRARTAENP